MSRVPVKIGELDQRIMFRSASEAPNDVGEYVKTWSDGESRWARVLPRRASEMISSGAVQAESQYVIYVRQDGLTIDVGNRIAWDGKTLEIESIEKHDGNVSLFEIIATEKRST